MDSPWGIIDYTQDVIPGIAWISTPGHGGLRIALQTARLRLSESAQRRAIVQAGYLWYEEDCLYAIPAYEMPDLWPNLFRHRPLPDQERRADLLHTISEFYPDYLLEREIEPEPRGFVYWLLSRLRDSRRQITQTDPQAAGELIPDFEVTVEIAGGVCQDVTPSQATTTFLRQLGISFSYRLEDHDVLEEVESDQ